MTLNRSYNVLLSDEAMKNLVDEMYCDCRLCTWTSIELHEKYKSYGGKLTRKQMLSKLAMHLGDDVVVLNIDGCASIIGFRSGVHWQSDEGSKSGYRR